MIGGVALLLSPVPLVNVLGGLGAIAGIALGIVALTRRGRSRVTALIGLPLSVVALAVSTVLVVVYSIAFNGWVEGVAEDAGSYQLSELQPVVFEPGSEEPAAPGVGMSPDNPAPFGSTVSDFNYGWDVSIGSPTLDATADITASYTLGHLEPGEQYASAPVTVTNFGPTRATPAVQVKFEYVTSDSRTLEPVSHLDGSVESLGGIDPGMTERGAVVFAIPSDDGDRGVWAVRFEFMSQLVYFGDPSAG